MQLSKIEVFMLLRFRCSKLRGMNALKGFCDLFLLNHYNDELRELPRLFKDQIQMPALFDKNVLVKL